MNDTPRRTARWWKFCLKASSLKAESTRTNSRTVFSKTDIRVANLPKNPLICIRWQHTETGRT